MSYNLFEASLNGVSLSSLGEENEIVLVDIVEEEAKMDTQTVTFGLKDGMMRTLNRRESLAVKIVFCIRTQDVVRRAELRDAVADWARKGGSLKTNTHPGKVLVVRSDNAVAIGSNAKWTDELTLTLTAYGVPYWQNIEMTMVVFESTKINDSEHRFTGEVVFDSQVDAQVIATLFNNGDAAMTRLKIQCGETMFEFDGMSIDAGDVVHIKYSADNYLSIEYGSGSNRNPLFPFRTAQSDDDLLMTAGKSNQIIVSADQPFDGNLRAGGCWL